MENPASPEQRQMLRPPPPSVSPNHGVPPNTQYSQDKLHPDCPPRLLTAETQNFATKRSSTVKFSDYPSADYGSGNGNGNGSYSHRFMVQIDDPQKAADELLVNQYFQQHHPKFINPGPPPIIVQFALVVRLLQFFGYAPLALTKFGTVSTRGLAATSLALWALGCTVLNMATIMLTIYVFSHCQAHFSALHLLCVGCVISGVKPLHNFMNLITFGISRQKHQKMIRLFQSADSEFRLSYGKYPPVCFAAAGVFTASFIVGSFMCTMRLVEYVILGETPGVNLINDLSILYVGFLTLWELIPMFYYIYMNVIIRFWFLTLEKELRKDRNLRKRRMKFYYEQYLQLTTCIASMSDFFNPFIFFSLVLSLIVLCLTIYFVTQFKLLLSTTGTSSGGPGPADPEGSTMPKGFQFQVIWSSTQIFVAFFYVVAICITGTITNERSRAIRRTILSLDLQDEQDRHEGLWFLHKIQCQHEWGLSVWKAFPLERPLLFTIISAMGTYAVLLMKLQPNHLGNKFDLDSLSTVNLSEHVWNVESQPELDAADAVMHV